MNKTIKIIFFILIFLGISSIVGYFGWKFYFDKKDDVVITKALTLYSCPREHNSLKYSTTKCSGDTIYSVDITCKNVSCKVINESIFPTIKDGDTYYIYNIVAKEKVYEGTKVLFADDHGTTLNFGVISKNLLIVYNSNKQYGIYNIETKDFFEDVVYKEISSIDGIIWTLKTTNDTNNKTYNVTTKELIAE